MFEVGEKVVYPNHGVSVVEEISSATFDETEQLLFHLRLLSNDSKVMVPKDNLELVGLRRLCNGAEIDALIDTLQDGQIETYKDWKGRYKQNLDKMKTGELTEVAGVLKNLSLVSQKKSLSFREKKMYERAKYFIVSEIAQVREMENEEAETLVEESLELSLEKLRKSKKMEESLAAAKADDASADDLQLSEESLVSEGSLDEATEKNTEAAVVAVDEAAVKAVDEDSDEKVAAADGAEKPAATSVPEASKKPATTKSEAAE
jgi:CarD family transcriptional regulator